MKYTVFNTGELTRYMEEDEHIIGVATFNNLTEAKRYALNLLELDYEKRKLELKTLHYKEVD